MKTHRNPSSLPDQKIELPSLTSSFSDTSGGGTRSNETSWRDISEAERRRALSNFFQRWSQPAEDLSECPPDKELLLIAREADHAKWPAHLQDCSRCRQLAELVGNPDRIRIPINEILSMSSRLANESEEQTPEGAFTPRKYVNAFYNSLRPRQVGVAVAALIVGVSLTSWIYLTRAPQVSNAYVVTLPEDNYWKATQWLRQTNAILADATLGTESKINQLKPFRNDPPQIRQAIASLGAGNLNNEERAELGKLLATYNYQIKILNRQSGGTPKTATEEPYVMTAVTETAYSRIVTEVWAAFGSTKDTPSIDPDTLDIQTAKALEQASKQTNVTSITDKEVFVQNLSPRSDTDRNEIQERINQLQREEGVIVTVDWSSKETSVLPQRDPVSLKLSRYQIQPRN